MALRENTTKANTIQPISLNNTIIDHSNEKKTPEKPKKEQWHGWGIKPEWPAWRTPPKKEEKENVVRSYPYQRGPVWNRAELKKLPGRSCDNCKGFYDSLLKRGYSKAEVRKLKNQCSRHRAQYRRAPSPQNVWKVTFTASDESGSE